MTLNHVHLGSAHFEQAKALYQRFFGFRVESVHGLGVFMRDSAGFLLVLDPVNESHVFPGWFHLGFCLSRESEVYEMYRALRDAGAKVVRDLLAERGEFASFYVADPDGVQIEVSWHVL